MTKYICPKCEEELEKIDIEGGKCPKCKTPLKFEKVRMGKQFRYHLILDDKPQVAPGLSSPAAQLPDREGVLLTAPGEVPQIFLIDDGDEGQRPPHYRVCYTGIIERGWVYCPACDGKMFQNYYLDTGQGDAGQGHKCQHCGALVDFVFQSVGVLIIRR
jgi:ssDNA-binding Zn-finger/Zn-ribbon topoisomerase 1